MNTLTTMIWKSLMTQLLILRQLRQPQKRYHFMFALNARILYITVLFLCYYSKASNANVPLQISLQETEGDSLITGGEILKGSSTGTDWTSISTGSSSRSSSSSSSTDTGGGEDDYALGVTYGTYEGYDDYYDSTSSPGGVDTSRSVTITGIGTGGELDLGAGGRVDLNAGTGTRVITTGERTTVTISSNKTSVGGH